MPTTARERSCWPVSFTEKEDRAVPIVNPHSKERLVPRLRTAGRTDIGTLRENNEDVASSAMIAWRSSPMGWEGTQAVKSRRMWWRV